MNRNATVYNVSAILEKLPAEFDKKRSYQKVNQFFKGWDEALSPDALQLIDDIVDAEYDAIKERIAKVLKEKASLRAI
jgi:hypothetical protein